MAQLWGAAGRKGRAHHDGPCAARAVRLPAARGRRRGVDARRPVRPPRRARRRRRDRRGVRGRRRPARRARARCSTRSCPSTSSSSRGGSRVEYCSTPARGLSLVSPHPGAKARMACGRRRRGPRDGLTERQRALLASAPRVAGRDLAALRRLERRGLVRLEPRAVRRAPEHAAVGARRAQPELPPTQAAALAEIEAAPRRASGSCCTASPARARPRSICRRPRRRSPRGAARSCSCPRSR